MADRRDDIDLLRSHLNDLATRVADALERGDEAGAWNMTAALERVVDPQTDVGPRPSWPVIGRRFAQVHRRILLAACGAPDRARVAVLAVVLGWGPDPTPTGAPSAAPQPALPRC